MPKVLVDATEKTFKSRDDVDSNGASHPNAEVCETLRPPMLFRARTNDSLKSKLSPTNPLRFEELYPIRAASSRCHSPSFDAPGFLIRVLSRRFRCREAMDR